MYTKTKNNMKLKQLYNKSLTMNFVISHSHIMDIVCECGDTVPTMEWQWDEAATKFCKALKNYDEAKNERRIQCLKNLVIVNMLM